MSKKGEEIAERRQQEAKGDLKFLGLATGVGLLMAAIGFSLTGNKGKVGQDEKEDSIERNEAAAKPQNIYEIDPEESARMSSAGAVMQEFKFEKRIYQSELRGLDGNNEYIGNAKENMGVLLELILDHLEFAEASAIASPSNAEWRLEKALKVAENAKENFPAYTNLTPEGFKETIFRVEPELQIGSSSSTRGK